MLFSMIIAVTLSILAVFFANYNRAIVQVNLFGPSVSGTLGIVIVVALGVGVLLGIATSMPLVIGRSWELLRARRELEDLRHATESASHKEFPPE
jgi:uncharacterized integral membrane protein